MRTYPLNKVILQEKGNHSFSHLTITQNMSAKINNMSYLEEIVIIHSILVMIFVFLMNPIVILNLNLFLAILIPL